MVGIYKITNLLNNQVYVGQSWNIQRRWREHKNPRDTRLKISRAILKYGVNNFKFEILEETCKDKLNEREIFWIKELNTFSPNGYNLTTGGNGNRETSDETKAKMSKNRLGKTRKLITCVTVGETFDGLREASEKYNTRQAHICSCCKGDRLWSGRHPVTKEKLVWVYTENLEEYLKIKGTISLEKKKGFFTEERRENQRVFNKMTKSKAVYSLVTQEIFISIGEASDKYNCSRLHVSECCHGNRRTEGVDPISGRRLQWCFLSDLEERLKKPIVDPEVKNKPKEVYCITTQEKFLSFSQAYKTYAISKNVLKVHLNGKRDFAGRHPLTNEPLRWCYTKDLETKLDINLESQQSIL